MSCSSRFTYLSARRVFYTPLYKQVQKNIKKALLHICCRFSNTVYCGERESARSCRQQTIRPITSYPAVTLPRFYRCKEAFCFKLTEGYLLALIMPLYLLLFSVRMLSFEGAAYGLLLIAFMLLFFTFRKVFMPLHFDIGDKSAYT